MSEKNGATFINDDGTLSTGALPKEIEHTSETAANPNHASTAAEATDTSQASSVVDEDTPGASTIPDPIRNTSTAKKKSDSTLDEDTLGNECSGNEDVSLINQARSNAFNLAETHRSQTVSEQLEEQIHTLPLPSYDLKDGGTTSHNKEPETSTLGDLINADILPWEKISKHLPSCVSSTLQSIGSCFNRMLYLLVAVVTVPIIFLDCYNTFALWSQSYEESYCEKYYSFDLQKLTHRIVMKHTGNSSNTTTQFIPEHCENSPMYFFGEILFAYLMPVLICLAWLYSTDLRYGFIKFLGEEFTVRLREKKIYIQIPIIVVLIPTNVILALILTKIGIPIIIMLSIFKSLCCCTCSKNSCSAIYYIFIGKFISEPRIFFLYSLSSLQEFCESVGICLLSLVFIVNYKGDNYTELIIKKYVVTFGSVAIIYRLIHIWINREKFKPFFNMINQKLPFFLSLWSVVDVILDIFQTKKYKDLARLTSISPYYFIVSVFSMIMPAVISFCMIIIKNKGFRVLRFFIGEKFKEFNSFTKSVILVFEVLIGIPIYAILSIMFCYMVTPCVLIKHGFDTIRKGQDDERIVDFSPLNVIMCCTSTKFRGILDMYGLKNFQSKSMPLLGGIEQIGEASIQTILTLIFIINNFGKIPELNTFLGVPFPMSLISLVFSIVSLSVGLYRSCNIISAKCKSVHQRIFHTDILT